METNEPLPEMQPIPREAVVRALQSVTMEDEAVILHDVLRLHELSPEKLREMILRIGPNGEVRAGKQMLLRLLDSSGVEGVANFVSKAQVALRHTDGLDLGYDFDPLEKREFKRSNGFSRRLAIPAICFGIPGMLYAVEGISELGAKTTSPETTIGTFWKNTEASLKECHWVSNTLIGVGLIHEAFIEKAQEYKLEQVADMVSELVERRTKDNSRGR